MKNSIFLIGSEKMDARSILLLKRIFFVWALLVIPLMSQNPSYSESELEAMLDEELEGICLERGFELVKEDIDPTTGLLYEFTHADYVDAAKRCLAIEQEMWVNGSLHSFVFCFRTKCSHISLNFRNELLDQYPELAEELEEEIKKMEAENAAKKAEVDELQKKIAEVQEAARGKNVSNLDAAFVSRPRTTINSEDRSLNLQEETVFVEDPKIGQTATGQAHEVDGKPQEEPEPIVEESNTAGLESPEATKIKEDLTLKALAVEIIRGLVRNANNDLKRIVELVAPVVRPLLEAGDKAWRRIRAAVVYIQQNYGNTNSQEEADTCADEVAS